MRVLLLYLSWCVVASAQVADFAQYLALTSSQRQIARETNTSLNALLSAKQVRRNTIRLELDAEYAKPTPDARALGDRYVELQQIDQELAAARASAQAKIVASLTPAQIAQLRAISDATLQQSLMADASCAFLADRIDQIPTFVFRLGNFSTGSVNTLPTIAAPYALFNFGNTLTQSECSSEFPISVRVSLSLTDTEVAAIQAQQTLFQNFNTQKQNRIADVQVEIRDETAKASPDPSALGVRYTELIEISHELTQADQQGRKAARGLLTPAQQAKLQSLIDNSSLIQYAYPAESCHFISAPAGSALYYSPEDRCSAAF